MNVLKKIFLICFLLFVKLSFSQFFLNEVHILDYKSNIVDTIYGIDVSRHQGKIIWDKIDTNINFAIIKVSEGASLVDSKFLKNWNECKLIKGGYHFFRPQRSGIEQAKLFLNNLPTVSGNIKPVVDVEYTYLWSIKKKRKSYVKNFTSMIDYMTEKIGYAPIIYTSENFWVNYIKPYYSFNHDFWLADYKGKLIHKSKLNWFIWQYTCKGRVKGIIGFVDKNLMTKKIEDILIK